jgi:hypothetical protein
MAKLRAENTIDKYELIQHKLEELNSQIDRLIYQVHVSNKWSHYKKQSLILSDGGIQPI